MENWKHENETSIKWNGSARESDSDIESINVKLQWHRNSARDTFNGKSCRWQGSDSCRRNLFLYVIYFCSFPSGNVIAVAAATKLVQRINQSNAFDKRKSESAIVRDDAMRDEKWETRNGKKSFRLRMVECGDARLYLYISNNLLLEMPKM